MKKNYIYTDLAYEKAAVKPTSETSEENPAASGINDEHIGSFRVLSQTILPKSNDIAPGRYVTICFPPPTGMTDREKEELSHLVKEKICFLISGNTENHSKMMVAGLGNRMLASDAIGPRCVDRLCITRHLRENTPSVFSAIGMEELSAISPGVMSQTGIESADIIKSVAACVKPDLLIAVDALCARETERLCATIQLSDTGISPGSGVGNARAGLSKTTVGCPVIGIGVPTVVRSSTLIQDAVERSGGSISKKTEALLENGRSYYVTLNEISEITDILAEILSNAINEAASIYKE